MQRQLSFMDLCDDFLEKSYSEIISALDKYLDINEIIPNELEATYYKNTGCPPYPLHSMVLALLIQRIFSIPTVSLLVIFLQSSYELRLFCGFRETVPDESTFSRFKNNVDLDPIFNRLVSLTEPMCQEIDPQLANIHFLDNTGLEAYVKENNPKFIATLEHRLKKTYPDKSTEEIIKLARSILPKHAKANNQVKLGHANGHFCYMNKAGIIVNGLGLVRGAMLFDDNISDSASLIPLYDHYLESDHKAASYVCADSGMDSLENFQYLVKDRNSIPIIKRNPRNTKNLPNPDFTSTGLPTCPKDDTLIFQYDGFCKSRQRSKYICPKAKKVAGGKYILHCDDPCTDSKCGRMIYTYPKDNYRAHPPIPEGTKKWDEIYKLRIIVEQAISMLKGPLGLGNLTIRKQDTINAELKLACITQLVVALVAYRANNKDKIRSVRHFAA